MSVAFNLSKSFELMGCGECGIDFYVPKGFYRERKEDGKGWSCPNGHRRVFNERENDRLKRELEVTKKRLEIAAAESAKEFQLRQRLEKRIANGVCPKCRRHFTNVERHMKKKHGAKPTRP